MTYNDFLSSFSEKYPVFIARYRLKIPRLLKKKFKMEYSILKSVGKKALDTNGNYKNLIDLNKDLLFYKVNLNGTPIKNLTTHSLIPYDGVILNIYTDRFSNIYSIKIKYEWSSKPKFYRTFSTFYINKLLYSVALISQSITNKQIDTTYLLSTIYSNLITDGPATKFDKATGFLYADNSYNVSGLSVHINHSNTIFSHPLIGASSTEITFSF